MKKKLYRSAQQAGFTLVELLAVIIIIGVLAAVMGSRFLSSGDKARADLAKVEMSQIVQALDLFKLEVGRYPTQQEGLDSLLKNPGSVPNWNGPYFTKKDNVKDPWQNDYKYVSPGAGNAPFDVKSLGADGKEGGEGPNADIVKS